MLSGFMWAVLAAVVWGICPLVEKAGLVKTPPMPGLFYRSVGVLIGLVMLGFFVVRPNQVRSVDARSAVLLMAGGFLASIVGQTCFYNALKSGEVSRLVPIAAAYPFVTFVLGVLFLGESATPLKVAAVGLIGAGVWLLRIG